MALPKEPRQLMINLMYLVLTALLALNVSNEILNAFSIIDSSIKRSTTNTTANTEDFIKGFEQELNNPSRAQKARPLYTAAKSIESESQALISYLEGLKQLVLDESGGVDEEGKPIRPDDIDAAGQLFIEGKKGGEPYKDLGLELQDKIQNYINSVGGKIDQNFQPQVASQLKNSFPVKLEQVKVSSNNPDGNWARGMFYNVPVAGALTILSKYQNDVSNAENQIIQTLYKQINDNVVFIEGYKLVASVNNAYVMAGDKVTGTVNVIPITSSSDVRRFSVSSGSLKPDPNNPTNTNVKMWEGTASGTGLQTVSVSVPVTDGYGRTKTETAQMQYMVGTAGATMQLDKMNVFYKGVKNPISISAAGVSMQDVAVSIPGASVSKTGLGKYDVDVTSLKHGSEINCTVTGQGKTMGKFPVRIKRVPDPVATMGGMASGNMPSNRVHAQLGVIAKLKNFDFDTKFYVQGFSFYLTKKGEDVKSARQSGAAFGNAVKTILKSAKAGDKIFIEDIRARGPGKSGELRKLSPIVINVT